MALHGSFQRWESVSYHRSFNHVRLEYENRLLCVCTFCRLFSFGRAGSSLLRAGFSVVPVCGLLTGVAALVAERRL